MKTGEMLSDGPWLSSFVCLFVCLCARSIVLVVEAALEQTQVIKKKKKTPLANTSD